MTAEPDWWGELDDAIVQCLAAHGSMTPVEMGQQLGMSAAAVVSLLGRLAQEGKVSIVRVALAPPERADNPRPRSSCSRPRR